MAAYTCQNSAHKTTTGTTVDSCRLDSYSQVIEVAHRGTADTLWFTIGPTVALTTDPVAEASETYFVLPGTSRVVSWPAIAGGTAAVKILGNTTPWSVMGLPSRVY
jgi:hypothetical protein